MYSRRDLAVMLVGVPVAAVSKPEPVEMFRWVVDHKKGTCKRETWKGVKYDVKPYGWTTTVKGGRVVKMEPLGWEWKEGERSQFFARH